MSSFEDDTGTTAYLYVTRIPITNHFRGLPAIQGSMASIHTTLTSLFPRTDHIDYLKTHELYNLMWRIDSMPTIMDDNGEMRARPNVLTITSNRKPNIKRIWPTVHDTAYQIKRYSVTDLKLAYWRGSQWKFRVVGNPVAIAQTTMDEPEPGMIRVVTSATDPKMKVVSHIDGEETPTCGINIFTGKPVKDRNRITTELWPKDRADELPPGSRVTGTIASIKDPTITQIRMMPVKISAGGHLMRRRTTRVPLTDRLEIHDWFARQLRHGGAQLVKQEFLGTVTGHDKNALTDIRTTRDETHKLTICQWQMEGVITVIDTQKIVNAVVAGLRTGGYAYGTGQLSLQPL